MKDKGSAEFWKSQYEDCIQIINSLLFPRPDGEIIKLLIELERRNRISSRKEVCSSIRHECKVRADLLKSIIKHCKSKPTEETT